MCEGIRTWDDGFFFLDAANVKLSDVCCSDCGRLRFVCGCIKMLLVVWSEGLKLEKW